MGSPLGPTREYVPAGRQLLISPVVGLMDSAEPPVDAMFVDNESSSMSDDETEDVLPELTPEQEKSLLAAGILTPITSAAERAALAQRLHAVAADAQRPDGGLYNDEALTIKADRREALLLTPLPFVHRGRRLSFSFLCAMEMRFYVYEARFAALAAFESAAQAGRPLMTRLRPILHALHPHAVTVAFLKWMADRQDTLTQHFVRERIGNPMAKAHLSTGEVERYFVDRLERAIAHGSPNESISEKPGAAEVLAQMSPLVYEQVMKYLQTSGEHAKRVIDGYLVTEAAAEREWRPIPAAHATERLALLLLPTLLDAALSRGGADHRICACSWIDELEQERACPPAFFASPNDAVCRRAGAVLKSKVMLVRFLRRTWVVVPNLVTLEVPTLSAGILLWLAFADMPLGKVPRPLRDAVRQLR